MAPDQKTDLLEYLKLQKKAGAEVKPLAEAPADIQAMAAEDFAELDKFKMPRRSATPVWRVVGGGLFKYTDGEFGCEIPDVRLDVFLAFTSQMQMYAAAAEANDPEKAMAALARAYVLLYHRPRWWERWFRRSYRIPKKRAINRLIIENPGRSIYTFVPIALAEYHRWVTGKKKTMETETPAEGNQDTAKA